MARAETRATIARAVVAESWLVEVTKKLGFDLDETIARKIVSGAAKLGRLAKSRSAVQPGAVFPQ